MIIPSTCNHQRLRYIVALDDMKDIDMCLDLCKLKYRPNQDPPIIVFELNRLANTLTENNKKDQTKYDWFIKEAKNYEVWIEVRDFNENTNEEQLLIELLLTLPRLHRLCFSY